MTHSPSDRDLWFLPIGGANEIGMNLNLLGHKGKWLMLDCGVTFSDRLGVDIIMPDPTFLIENKKDIIALVVTHGHEDHIGAIPFLWPFVKCPIYATPFTLSLIRHKLAEYSIKDAPLVELPLSSKLHIGPFGVELTSITHSIPESNVITIETDLGTVVHTGDWKIDPEPLVGEPTHEVRLREIGDKGVLAIICDSTNVLCEGESGSEGSVRVELTKLIAEYPKNRLTVCCFASNIARVETVAHAAEQNGRKVCLIGRSLERLTQCARETGYLTDVKEFISLEEALRLPDSKILFISTGSQGEARAALSRISQDQHRLRMDERDVVLFSSRVIPGNEKLIGAVQNRLVRKGVKIVTAQDYDIHVSGHPSRDELRRMYAWIRPKILVPVHGEARHLEEQAKLGKETGINKCIIPDNGSLIVLSGDNPRILETLPTTRWMYDGNRLIPSTSSIMRDRQKLSMSGVACVSLCVDGLGQLTKTPHVSFIGVCEPGDETDLLTKECIRVIRQNMMAANDKESLDRIIQACVRNMISHRLDKKPIVEVHWIPDRI